MFVGTGAVVLVVCPSDVEMVRGAEDVPAGVPVEAPVLVGACVGSFPHKDAVGVGVGAACSISSGSSVESAEATADGAGAGADDAAGGGACGAADAVVDAAGVGCGATSPSCVRMTNTATAPMATTTSAVSAATVPLDIFRALLTGTEIGAAALMLALTLTADVGACGCDG